MKNRQSASETDKRKLSKLAWHFYYFLATGMFLMPYLPVSKLFEGAARLIKMVIRKILLLLKWIFTRDVSEMEFWEESKRGEIGAIEAGEPSLLAQFLEWFLVLAVGIVLTAGAIYLLIRFFMNCTGDFMKRIKRQQMRAN